MNRPFQVSSKLKVAPLTVRVKRGDMAASHTAGARSKSLPRPWRTLSILKTVSARTVYHKLSKMRHKSLVALESNSFVLTDYVSVRTKRKTERRKAFKCAASTSVPYSQSWSDMQVVVIKATLCFATV
jgi:hypothetical protein